MSKFSISKLPHSKLLEGREDQFATQGARRNTKMQLPQGRIRIDLHSIKRILATTTTTTTTITTTEQHPDNIFENKWCNKY